MRNSADQKGQTDVFRRSQILYQVVKLKYEPELLVPKARQLGLTGAFYSKLACDNSPVIRSFKSRQQVQESRFSRPGASHDCDTLAGAYGKRNATQNVDKLAIGLTKALSKVSDSKYEPCFRTFGHRLWSLDFGHWSYPASRSISAGRIPAAARAGYSVARMLRTIATTAANAVSRRFKPSGTLLIE